MENKEKELVDIKELNDDDLLKVTGGNKIPPEKPYEPLPTQPIIKPKPETM